MRRKRRRRLWRRRIKRKYSYEDRIRRKTEI
jgi:hypothetical protein